jgi:hypothetical chaperone protein
LAKFNAGIDFGTTNTTIAMAGDNSAPHIVPVESGKDEIPTAIFFEENTGKVYFGQTAQTKYMNGDEGRFMRSLKRVLGSNLMKTGTNVAGSQKKFQDIIGYFIKNLKDKLDAAAGENVENVVMGRPVHFRDNDADGDARAENELLQIAQKAGFKNVLFQFEPIAAAFAHEQKLATEQLAVVIDIGGGTSDFTIIRLGGNLINKSDRRDDILANTGVRIGGNDFDKQLSLKTFMPEFGKGTEYKSYDKNLSVPTTQYFDLSEWSQVNSLYTYKNLNMVKRCFAFSLEPEKYGRLLDTIEKQLGHKVLAAVENTKIALTDKNELMVDLDFMSSRTQIPANRKDFEESIEANTLKIIDSVKECVKLSGVKPDAVQLIILTGGSTEIPYIRDTLCGLFPNAKVSGENKLSSVGLGLAFDAMRRFKNQR